jgi:hypothetical protein
MVRHPLVVCALILSAICCAFGAELEPDRPGQESSITRAVFAGNRLWLLTDAGTLSSIEEGSPDSIDAELPEPVFDLWVQEGAPAILTGRRGGGGDWTLRLWAEGEWKTQAHIRTRGDSLIGAAAYGGSTTLLTRHRLIEVSDHRQREVPVAWSNEWRLGGIASILVTRRSVLVGINNGEWGGELKRVDRRTGAVSSIDSRLSGERCGQAPSPECDPVNAIVEEPGKRDCAVLAVGLVHMMTQGGIFEVCGNAVRALYTRPVRWDSAGKAVPSSDAYSTLPFFGASAVGQDLWAVGLDGIYKVGAGGAAMVTPLPAFQRIGGVSVSFALPGVVLVLTDVNQRRSLSGSVPLMVPR